MHQTNGEKLGYALSLKTEFDVKHMKIDSSKAGGNFFYLSDTRKFRSGSIGELGRHSLFCAGNNQAGTLLNFGSLHFGMRLPTIQRY